MLPRYHIIFGAIFTFIIWIFAPNLNPLYIAFIFLSSFLIDFDHYAAWFLKTKNLSLFKSFKYHKKEREIEEKQKKKGIRKRGDFHVFHTVEFHFLVALLGFIWIGFFYIFIGMIFHSLLDLVWLLYEDRFYRREYFFFNWAGKKIR